MSQPLKGKVAIVTGAGRGIGAGIAKRLAASRAKVSVNDINPDRAERVASQIREEGGEAIGIAADVSNKYHCVNLVESTRAEWGQLDILVNCASVAPEASVLKMDEWDWARCLDVNLKGTFFMSQLCGRVMADENQERGGVIINVSSTAGLEMPMRGRAAYCASKAGILGFSRECAREFAQYGVHVRALIQDEIGGGLKGDAYHEDGDAKVTRWNPLPGTTSQELVEAVLRSCVTPD